MKKYIAIAATVVAITAGCSAGTQTKNTTAKLSLDNENAKFSYAIGLDVGKSLKRIGTKLDLTAFDAAVESVIKGEKPMLSPKEAAAVKQSVLKSQRKKLMSKQKDLGLKNKAEGEKFLAENAKKEGVKTTASGLQYKVLRSGNGKKPTATDSVTVNYEGRLINGTVFDSSYKRGKPVTFPLNGVIKGWTEGLQLMPAGSKYRFFLPPKLAYGARGAGGIIGPDATLIFDVELLSIKK